MKTNSTVMPSPTQHLQGMLLVRFDIKEVVQEDGSVLYEYYELKLPENSSELQIQDAITAYKATTRVVSISPRQARLKLLREGLLDNLESLIATNREWGIEWEFATEVLRNSPLVEAVATQAGLTEDQIDQMFLEASRL